MNITNEWAVFTYRNPYARRADLLIGAGSIPAIGTVSRTVRSW